MAVKRTVIVLTKDKFEALRKSQNAGRSQMYNALNYTSNSQSAQNIRRLALSMYGGEKTTKIIW